MCLCELRLFHWKTLEEITLFKYLKLYYVPKKLDLLYNQLKKMGII